MHTEQARIGYSPFYLCHGFEPNLPYDIIYGPTKFIKNDILQFGTRFTSELRTAFDTVNKLRKYHNEKTKNRYDNPPPPKKRYNPDLKIGTHVLLRVFSQTNGRSKKFLPRWTGPYTVKAHPRPLTYVITDGQDKVQTVHVQRLLPYVPWSYEQHANEHPHHIFKDRPVRLFTAPTLATAAKNHAKTKNNRTPTTHTHVH